MSTLKNILVDIPKRTAKQKNGNTTYIYLRTRYYRNANKKSTTDRVAIGKLDEKSGRMIPNERYFEMFHLPIPDLPERIQNIGLYHTVKTVSEKIGLLPIVKKAFPNTWKEIMSMSQYMLCGKSSMVYLSDWLDENISFTKESMHSSKISEQFNEISLIDKTSFFSEWMNKRSGKEFLAYDVSSISTYSKNIENAEWGYNRDKEKLPQINMALYYGEKTKLPYYYRTYPGSITDKMHLQYMVEDLKDIDHKYGKYIMDRGFYTRDNLVYLTESGCRFLIAMPAYLDVYEKLIELHRNEIVDNYSALIKNKKVYCKSYIVNDYGFRMKAHIYYDEKKKPVDVESFYSRLEDMEKALSRMDSVPAKNTNYCKFFNIKKEGNHLIYQINETNVNKELSYCGFFILVETFLDESSESILETYRNRDTIEKCFDDLKNEIDLNRLRVHSSDVAEGKMFVAFITLIIRSAMCNLLHEYMEESEVSFYKIILELNKIKVKYRADNEKGFRFLNPLTKTQKRILSDLGFDPIEFFSECVV